MNLVVQHATRFEVSLAKTALDQPMAAARASASSAPSHLTSTSVPQGIPAAMKAIGDLPLTSFSGATTVTSQAYLPMVEANNQPDACADPED